MKKINKIMIYGIVVLMLMTLVNGGTFIYNQDEARSIADTSEGNNAFEVLIFGSDNLNVTSALNDTITYDVNFEVVLSDNMFFVFENNVAGQVLNISYNFDDKELSPGVLEIMTTTITLDDEANYVFAFSPDFEGERLEMWIDYPDTVATNEIFKFTRQRGIGDISDQFISAMITLVEINIGLWRILFYVFLLGIVLGVFALIGNFIMEILDWAEKFRERRRKHLRKRD